MRRTRERRKGEEEGEEDEIVEGEKSGGDEDEF